MAPPRVGQGAALVAFPEGCRVRSSERSSNTGLEQCNDQGCENRAKCGRLEGAALFAQAAEHTSMSPGKDGEGPAASRTADPEGSQNPKHQSSASPLELHPTVEPTKRPQVPKSLWSLFVRDWITTGWRPWGQ